MSDDIVDQGSPVKQSSKGIDEEPVIGQWLECSLALGGSKPGRFV